VLSRFRTLARPEYCGTRATRARTGHYPGASREELRVRIHGLQQASRDRAEVSCRSEREAGGRGAEDADGGAAYGCNSEDKKTADYVAQKFRAAGLDTEIVPYRVLMNQPKVVKVEAFDAAGNSS